MVKQRFLFLPVVFIFFFSITCSVEVLFSPDDHPRKKLISLINNAQKRVYAAVYLITDRFITQALIDAKERGVDVELVSDQSCAQMSYGKLPLLKKHKIPIYIYWSTPKRTGTGGKMSGPIMHDKFAIIDEKIWTGSYNWTKSASEVNQENAIILIEEPEACSKFEKQFAILKERCTKVDWHKSEDATTQKETGLFVLISTLIEDFMRWLKQILGTLV